jgi:phage baseplate assembly protein W
MALLQKSKLFVGYSTVGTNSKSQQFADIELIKHDLLNHFYTRKGERLMMPTYGCGIWDMLFEPFDATTKDTIIYECQRVIDSDSRVQWQHINASEFDYGFVVQMDLLYIPYNVIDSFNLQFDRRSLSNF